MELRILLSHTHLFADATCEKSHFIACENLFESLSFSLFMFYKLQFYSIIKSRLNDKCFRERESYRFLIAGWL